MTDKPGFDRLLDLLYPAICGFCRRRFLQRESPFPGVCRTCLHQIPIRQGEDRHVYLRASGQDPVNAICACYYQGPVRQALIRMKFSDAPETCDTFAALLADAITRAGHGTGYSAVAAVPLHPARKRERGYNQAALVAHGLARRLLLPDWSDGLARSRRTGRQSELKTLSERRDNVANAFSILSPALFTGQRIILVDDILSTGATLLAVHETLIKAGAACVLPVAVASGDRKSVSCSPFITDS